MSRVDIQAAERRSDTLPDDALNALLAGRHGDPFAVLGPHQDGDTLVVRACVPGAQAVTLTDAQGTPLADMTALHEGGVFSGRIAAGKPDYQLRLRWPDGQTQLSRDPYAFGLLLGELDLHLIAEGRHFELGSCLGAQWRRIDGVEGVRFAVWAPNARRVSVIGDFNGWHPARHPMRLRQPSGIWELFIPEAMGAKPGSAI